MSPRPLLVLVACVFVFILLKRAVSSWLGGKTRREMYRELGLDHGREERCGRGDIQREGACACPLCGAPTERVEYPHIDVLRCTRYPECRGFVKAPSKRRPSFASDWDRRRRRKGG